MRSTLASLLAIIACASAHLASHWPEQPLSKSETVHMPRALADSSEQPDIGMFHIILWSSLTITIAMYFAVMALVNMDVGNDSLLYSKAKMD